MLHSSQNLVVNKDNRWIIDYCHYSWDEWSSGSRCDRVLQFFGDTITIDQKTYRELVSLSAESETNSYKYYREEAGSIYARSYNSENEELLFDFELLKGDTFYLSKDYNERYPIWVDSTYTYQLASGKQRKALDLSTLFLGELSPASWIEGVGSVSLSPFNSGGTLNSNATFITDIWDNLICLNRADR